MFTAMHSKFQLSLLACVGFGLAAPDVSQQDSPEVPTGLPREQLGKVLVASAEQVELGRQLFFDPLLSSDRSVSCSSCHSPEHGFADTEPLSTGVAGRKTLRNSPTLLNRALGRHFMWDGTASTLEDQVLLPIENPLEMDLPLSDALARLSENDDYRSSFDAAYGGPPNKTHLAAALAAFVRRQLHGDSRVDRFRQGEHDALTPEERGGMWLFESRAGCWQCHVGANFTDEDFHNTGVSAATSSEDTGRRAVTGKPEDTGAFKTPTLRALAVTAPYMHDGSLTTLEEVVEFYRKGGHPNPDLDEAVLPIHMSDRDAQNLVAFLRALSDH